MLDDHLPIYLRATNAASKSIAVLDAYDFRRSPAIDYAEQTSATGVSNRLFLPSPLDARPPRVVEWT
ncbi:MAG TPA: hypothetical protein VHZ24_04245 [Pirellulales bacterium]|jgi:hypothetical protein|nr:hypothetical protein [Pirellulales bacterium]